MAIPTKATCTCCLRLRSRAAEVLARRMQGWTGGNRAMARREVTVTHSKAGRDDPAQPPAVVPLPTSDQPAPPAPPPSPPPRDGFEEPRALGSVLDDALERMERRARGDERPIPLPWSNVSAALGGGLWGGTLVTLVGDTGTGKTQWALQAAIHAAEAGVPACYVAPDSGVDQMV